MIWLNHLGKLIGKKKKDFDFWRYKRTLVKYRKKKLSIINEVLLRSYLKSLNELKNTINSYESGKALNKNDLNNSLVEQFIVGRLTKVNSEFFKSLKNDMFFSMVALTRQINEMYIISLYRKISPNVNKILLGIDKSNKMLDTQAIINKLKKSSIIPSNVNFTSFSLVDYYNLLYEDFGVLSNIIHSKRNIFEGSALKIKDESDNLIKTELFSKEPYLNKGEKLIIFPHSNQSNIETSNFVVNRYFFYLHLIIQENKLN